MALNTELSQCDRKGSEFSLYYNSGNNCGTPVWVYHKGITGDLSINETEDEEELSVRDPAQIVKQYVEAKIDVEIAGQQVVDPLYEGCRILNATRYSSWSSFHQLVNLSSFCSFLNSFDCINCVLWVD